MKEGKIRAIIAQHIEEFNKVIFGLHDKIDKLTDQLVKDHVISAPKQDPLELITAIKRGGERLREIYGQPKLHIEPLKPLSRHNDGEPFAGMLCNRLKGKLFEYAGEMVRVAGRNEVFENSAGYADDSAENIGYDIGYWAELLRPRKPAEPASRRITGEIVYGDHAKQIILTVDCDKDMAQELFPELNERVSAFLELLQAQDCSKPFTITFKNNLPGKPDA